MSIRRIRAMFEKVREVDAVVSCAGNAAFKPFGDLTDADYELGLRSKLMGQVSLARLAESSGQSRPRSASRQLANSGNLR